MRAALIGSVLVAMAAVAPQPLLGQDDEEGEWTLGGELGASLFYGSSQQYAVTARGRTAYERGGFELDTRVGFDYGEASEQGEAPFVSTRGWSAQASVDYDEGRWAPFIAVSAQGSLQRRLDHRTKLGAGARYRLVDSERSRVDLSASLSAELTDVREEPGEVDDLETKGRWEALLRLRRAFGAEEKMTFSISSAYEPALMDAANDYVVDTEAGLSYALTSTVKVELIFENTFDSLANERGAPARNDGRIFFLIGANLG